MGASYLLVSAACTVLSFVGLQWWTEQTLQGLQSDGLISDNYIHSGNAIRVLDLLLTSHAVIALLVNFALNVFILLILCLKVNMFLCRRKLMYYCALGTLVLYAKCIWGSNYFHLWSICKDFLFFLIIRHFLISFLPHIGYVYLLVLIALVLILCISFSLLLQSYIVARLALPFWFVIVFIKVGS